MAILLAFLIYAALVFAGAWVVQVALEAIIEAGNGGVDVSVPYWPVFWILVVAILFVKGGSSG